MKPLLGLLFTAAATGQGSAGFRDTTFANTTGQGSAALPATVYYPATAAGRDAPLLQRAGGHPVVVFLHGLNVLGSGYGALGRRFAEHGYVVVLGNTAQSSATTQTADGIATFPALVQANGQAGHFLYGALDMQRVGIAGHSMGGATTPGVLASNPGYRAGFCFAPGLAPAAPQVQVPMGICHGTGDNFLSWQTFGTALYQNLTAVTDLKFFYLLGQDCTHGNVAGYTQATQVDRDVFASSSSVALGFFDAFLRGQWAGLEACIGPTSRAEPRLVQLDSEVRAPQLWCVGAAVPGSAVQFRIAAEPGLTGLFCALNDGNWPSPFGTVLLDPTTLVFVAGGSVSVDDLWSFALAIPNDPGMVGLQLPFQGIGSDPLANLRVTGPWRLVVGP